MSETPRTDAALEHGGLLDVVKVACELERENARLRDALFDIGDNPRIVAMLDRYAPGVLAAVRAALTHKESAGTPNTQPANKPSVAFGPKRP